MKIKEFLKENWAIIAIIIFALAIRLWYFYITYGQANWWDSSEYLSQAKHYAFDLQFDVNPQRPPFFQYIASAIFSAGLPGPGVGEELFILLCVLLPSVLLVWAVYLLAKEMFNASGYGKTIALIAAALSAVGWSWVFWSNRVEPDFLSMVFQVLAVLFMWKYWKSRQSATSNIRSAEQSATLQTPPVSASAEAPAVVTNDNSGREERLFHQKLWAQYSWVILAGAFSAFGFYFKISALLVPMCFMAFIALKEGLAAFKDKGYWMYVVSFIFFLAPYFLWAYNTFGDIFAFKSGYIDAPQDFPSFGWYNLQFYQSMTDQVLYVIFLVAVLLAMLRLFSQSTDKEGKKLSWEERCMHDGKLFCLIVFTVVSCFYIFYMRNTDDRWIFLWMPFIYALSAWFLVEAARYFIKDGNSRKWIMVGIWIIVACIAVQQLQHADALIKYKADSYGPVRDAALWIKANSPPTAKVLSISYPQTVYYSERNVSTYSGIKSAEEFRQKLIENKWEFMQVSIFEPHPSWVYTWTNEQAQKGNIVPVQIYWLDQAKTQPSLIVYFINIIEQNQGVNVTL